MRSQGRSGQAVVSPLRVSPTLAGAVADLAAAFTKAGLETPSLDARRLVLGCLHLAPVDLLREPGLAIAQNQLRRIDEAAARRLAREPVSRILGERAFHGLDLEIGPATLDPRPDTETLVDGVLELIEQNLVPNGRSPRILDIGTGSGAILVALLHRLPAATGLGIDISDAALSIAARNAARHGIADRASFRRSDWLAAVEGQFDLVVSNPPYIATCEIAALDPEVSLYDPVTALDGGSDGLAAYRAIAAQCGRVLADAGWLVVEVGQGQSEPVTRLLAETAAEPLEPEIRVWADLSGMPRCVALRARP
jgi:release factor glutamine methyltransferase